MQSFSLVKAKRVPRTLLQCEDSDEEPQPSTGPETIVRVTNKLRRCVLPTRAIS